jgi:choline dehydrogenase-like flavoprotein
MIDNLIIGSGPSGISVAYALASKGEKVTILDAGYVFEEERRQMIKPLLNKRCEEWGETDSIFKGDLDSSISGISEKRLFGSDFSTRQNELYQIKKKNAFFFTSLAKGGLSNIWGRGIEPVMEKDTAKWPISYAKLKPYYLKVLQFVPLSACKDSLEVSFPLFTEHYNKPILSRQASKLISNFNENQSELATLGLTGGVSRIAATYTGGKNDCNQCGKCLYGCPYGLLYSSTDTLDKLIKERKLEYIPGYIVDRIEENGRGSYIKCIEEKSGNKVNFYAEKVYLATGPYSSAKILTKSMELFDHELILKNSDMYYIPALLMNPPNGVMSERLITASLISMVLEDHSISNYSISMHCYLYSELFQDILNNLVGVLKKPAKPFIDKFLNRFFMIFAFIHSNESSHLSAVLDRKKDVMIINGIENPNRHLTEKKLKRKLRLLKRLTGFFPLPFYKDNNLPGSSMHSGASFPMGKTSDLLGRPDGFRRLHIVDASVLPDIPSGSFTFTVMANAYRIAEES